VRLALGLLIVPVVGCSQILGIQDPSAGSDGGRDAGPIDAPPTGDHLEFSIGNFSVAQQQMARFQVLLVHQSGQKEDVTGSTMLTVTSQTPATGTLGQDDTARIFSAAATGSSKLVAAYPSALSASIIATVTTFTCHPVINEFQTGGTAGGSDEFIEIYNPCTADMPVANWTLDYRSFNVVTPVDPINDTFTLITLAGTITKGGFRLYVGSKYSGTETTDGAWGTNMGLADMGGSIALRDATGKVVDSLGYGDVMAGNVFIEGAACLAPPPSGSVSRSPFDGNDAGIGAVDGNNSTNFAITTTTTPGARNFP
jgi:hypothetical protein